MEVPTEGYMNKFKVGSTCPPELRIQKEGITKSKVEKKKKIFIIIALLILIEKINKEISSFILFIIYIVFLLMKMIFY